MAAVTEKREKPDFAEVYEQEYSYVYNYVYMQVMHRENTEDLVSDVFIRAMAHYSGFDPAKASVRTVSARSPTPKSPSPQSLTCPISRCAYAPTTSARKFTKSGDATRPL
jgi:hypothetical protein